MALYFGSSKKLKINLGNAIYNLNLYDALSVIADTVLLSSDDCYLKDTIGLYLTVKENQ